MSTRDAQRQLVDALAREAPIFAWSATHHTTEDGTKLDFVRRPYLVGLYTCDAPSIVLKKSAQSGGSVWLVLQALYHSGGPTQKKFRPLTDSDPDTGERVDRCGLKIMYLITTGGLRDQFVNNRLNPSLQNNEEYRAMRGGMAHRKKTDLADSLNTKQFNRGSITLLGSNPEAGIISHPVDILMVDEYDRCVQANINEAMHRLDNSNWQFLRCISTPTITSFGIDALFQESDGREWLVKCEHCGKRQVVGWLTHIAIEEDEGKFTTRDRKWEKGSGRDIFAICDKCGGVLDRLGLPGRGCGEWVPAWPSNTDSVGFHISKLQSPQKVARLPTIQGLFKNFRKGLENAQAMQDFQNMDLGLANDTPGSRVTEEMLDACVCQYGMPAGHSGPCVAGIDVGSKTNIIIMEKDTVRWKTVWIGAIRNTQNLDGTMEILERYGVKIAVIDLLPQSMAVRTLQEAARPKGITVHACEYASQPGHPLVAPEFKEFNTLRVERTDVIDAMVGKLTANLIQLPYGAKNIDDGDFYSQMGAMARQLREDKSGYQWVGDKDHYGHAMTYASIAADIQTGAIHGTGFQSASNEIAVY